MKLRGQTADLGRPTMPPLGTVLEFMQLIWRLDNALQKTSKRMQIHLGLTGPQRLVIRVLGRFPGMRAGQLAELLCVHPSTLTPVLQRLERRGLVVRRQDPRDGRRALLGLTVKGRQLDYDSEGTVEAAVRLAIVELPEQKVRAAAEVLQALCVSLQATGSKDAVRIPAHSAPKGRPR